MSNHQPVPPDDTAIVNRLVQNATNIIVIAGAGISTVLGIRDFRSTNGYYRIEVDDATNYRGKDLFHVNILKTETFPFFCRFMNTMHRQILERKPKIGPAHAFIQQLHDQGRLVRCYTQNIDGIEKDAGLPIIDFDDYSNESDAAEAAQDPALRGHCIQLHGNIHQLRCDNCRFRQPWIPLDDGLFGTGRVPTCSRCVDVNKERGLLQKRLRKYGVMLPDVLLYGKQHPEEDAIYHFSKADTNEECDLLIVLGTEAQVPGTKTLIRSFADNVHERRGKVVMINKTLISASTRETLKVDYFVQQPCEDWLQAMNAPAPSPPITPDRPAIVEPPHNNAVYTPASAAVARSLGARRLVTASRRRMFLDSLPPPGTYSWQDVGRRAEK